MDLGAHTGEHRLFLTFAASPRNGGVVRQYGLLEGCEEGFAERDLVRGGFFEDGTGSFDGRPVSPGEAEAARGRFGVEPGRFVALLVGKDGTVKRRFHEPVGPDDLYDIVDSMPMRRREMRERGGPGG